MSEYTIKIEGLDRLSSSLRNSPRTVVAGLSEGMRTSVNLIRPVMFKNAPVKTRKLRRNIYAVANGLTGEVGPNLAVTPYAIFVHEGTDPYIIRPVSKKALYWKGAAHPVRIVHHPGIKPNPFVERTYNEIKEPVNLIFQQAANKIINNLK